MGWNMNVFQLLSKGLGTGSTWNNTIDDRQITSEGIERQHVPQSNMRWPWPAVTVEGVAWLQSKGGSHLRWIPTLPSWLPFPRTYISGPSRFSGNGHGVRKASQPKCWTWSPLVGKQGVTGVRSTTHGICVSTLDWLTMVYKVKKVLKYGVHDPPLPSDVISIRTFDTHVTKKKPWEAEERLKKDCSENETVQNKDSVKQLSWHSLLFLDAILLDICIPSRSSWSSHSHETHTKRT